MPEREKAQKLAPQQVAPKNIVRSVLRALPLPFVPGVELHDLLKDLERSRTAMGAKVDRASRSLADAAELVKELQSELDDRLEKVAKLKAEYDKYEQLATLAEDKAGAIIKQFRETVDNGRSRERWIALGISLVAGIIVFVLGAVLGPPLLKWLGIGA